VGRYFFPRGNENKEVAEKMRKDKKRFEGIMRRVAGVCVVMCGLAVHAELHEFNLPDGRSLKAEIVGYKARIGEVELKREDGKTVSVKPSVFVDDDRTYIQDWVAAHAFMSERVLKIVFDDQVVKKWKEEEVQDVRYTDGSIEEDFIHNVVKYENVAYDFTFLNMTATPIKDLLLEYCIYYEQSTMIWEDKPEVEKKTMYGKIEVPVLREQVTVKVSSKPVMIYEDDINPVPLSDEDQRRPGRGEIKGMRARLRMKNGSGDIVREMSHPSALSAEKYPWSTTSSPNTRKAYSRRRRSRK
jgi:hypothetical protein